jgi:hypothetical protein
MTPAGLKTLRRWIGPTPPPIATALPVDALRLRIRFMGALPGREQTALIKKARQELTKWLKWLESESAAKRKDPDKFLYLAFRGSIIATKGRLALLDEAERVVAASARKRR